MQLCDHRALLIGQHLRLDLGDPKTFRDSVGGGPVVAGQHDDLDALGRQRLQRIRRRWFDRIGDGEQPGQLAVDGHVDHGRAVAAQALGLGIQRLRVDAERLQENRVTENDGLAFDLAGGALAGRRVELVHPAEIEVALPGRPHDGVSQRMFAGALDAGGQPQEIGLGKSRGRNDRDHLRLAFGQRAGFVDHQRVDLLHALERFGVLDQHAGLRAAPDTDHDRHRRGEAERAGAGDDEDADGSDKAERQARLRPEPGPCAERQQRHDDDGRHEPAGHLVGEPLDRRPRTLRIRHHLHDLRKQRVAPDLVGAHHESAGLIQRAGDDLAAGVLGDRHGFARHQRFIQRRAAFEDDAVHGHLFAGPDAQTIADRERVDLHFMIGAIVSDAARGFRRELQQGLDRA